MSNLMITIYRNNLEMDLEYDDDGTLIEVYVDTDALLAELVCDGTAEREYAEYQQDRKDARFESRMFGGEGR